MRRLRHVVQVHGQSGRSAWESEAPRSKAPRYLYEILRSPSTLLRQGYGGFSSPSSSQQAARYSAKENKSEARMIRYDSVAIADSSSRATTNFLTCSKSTRRVDLCLAKETDCFHLCVATPKERRAIRWARSHWSYTWCFRYQGFSAKSHRPSARVEHCGKSFGRGTIWAHDLTAAIRQHH